MNLSQLLAICETLGIVLDVDDNHIVIDGPDAALTEELVADLREQKTELFATLASRHEDPNCDRCGSNELDARPAFHGPSRVFCAQCGRYLGRGDDVLNETMDPSWADRLINGNVDSRCPSL